MSYETVNLYILDDTPFSVPIPNVLVKVFDGSGITGFAELLTDDTGLAAALLPAPARYQVRCFKQQVAFGRPTYLSVLENPAPPLANNFNIRGNVFVPPTSSDPRLCIASGFFRRPDGSMAANVDIHFIAQFNPALLDGSAVLVERVVARTDKTGFVAVSLIRNGKYDTTIQGFEDVTRAISVPDLPATNLPDLLFPVVASVVFDVPGPFTLTVGEDLTLTPTVTASSGLTLDGTAMGDLFWRTSDQNILGVLLTATTVTLRGIGAGSAQCLVVRSDQNKVVRIPDTPITGVPLSITVA